MVAERAVRNRLAAHVGDAHFAKSDRARCHVEDNRGIVGARHDCAEWIGLQAPFAAAPGRDQRLVADDVDEVDGYKARLAATLAVGSDPAEVVCIAKP